MPAPPVQRDADSDSHAGSGSGGKENVARAAFDGPGLERHRIQRREGGGHLAQGKTDELRAEPFLDGGEGAGHPVRRIAFPGGIRAVLRCVGRAQHDFERGEEERGINGDSHAAIPGRGGCKGDEPRIGGRGHGVATGQIIHRIQRDIRLHIEGGAQSGAKSLGHAAHQHFEQRQSFIAVLRDADDRFLHIGGCRLGPAPCHIKRLCHWITSPVMTISCGASLPAMARARRSNSPLTVISPRVPSRSRSASWRR